MANTDSNSATTTANAAVQSNHTDDSIVGSRDMNMLDRMAMAHLFVQQRRYKARMYRDLVLFLVFYSLFLAAVFLQRDVNTAHHTESTLRDTFIDEEFLYEDAFVLKNLEAIGEVEEFWQWTLGPFLGGVSQQSPAEQGFIKRFNRLIGSPRVRQFRVRDDQCLIAAEIEPFYGDTGCYALFSDDSASTAPYGPSLDSFNSTVGLDAFGVNPCASQNALPGFCHRDTTSPPIYGRVATWYGAGGYYVDLSYNADQARLQLEALRDSNWIDLQTSAIVFTVNVFNPNVAMFVNMIILVEFTPGGGFIMSHNFRSFRSDLYHSTIDFVRLAIEIVWVVMLTLWLVYTVWQMWEVKRVHGSVALWLIRPWWNLVDLVNKIVFLATTVLYALFCYRLDRFKASIVDLNQDTDFVKVEELSYDWVLLFNIVAVNIIISTFTIFKFLNVNPRMSMMWKTLEKAIPDLVAFLIFFAIIFLTFVTAAYLMFGSKLSNFRTYTKSIFACFNMLLGDFSYEDMEEKGNRYFAPFFLTLFMILVTFILVNMFLAIVQDAYVVVQTKYANRPTLSVALRHWVSSQADKVRTCIGKALPSETGELAVVEISNARLKRYLQQLNVQDGSDLTFEQIMRALPNAPEAHVEYLYNLVGDPDALRAAREAADAAEAEGEDGPEDDADVARDDPQRQGPIEMPDVLRSLLSLEDRLAALETEMLNAQVRRLQTGSGDGMSASGGGLSGASGGRGVLNRLKSTKNIFASRNTQDYERAAASAASRPDDVFGSLPPLPSAALQSSGASAELQSNLSNVATAIRQNNRRSRMFQSGPQLDNNNQ
jgi:hypothetical protein